MLDITESGRQIGEKLFMLLDVEQKKELTQFVLSGVDNVNLYVAPCSASDSWFRWDKEYPMMEIQRGDLYLCLERRFVSICGREIRLTAKEFDILVLLIANPKRVFTYEMITELVWKEEYATYSRKAIINHISNLRKKLKISPDTPDYIKSVHSVGYKFDPSP